MHKKGLIPAPLPRWLQPLLDRLAGLGLYGGRAANHVLVNSYQPGEGIMPHEDGPLYHPQVAILSLAGPAVVRFAAKRTPAQAEAGKQARSLFSGAAASDHRLVEGCVQMRRRCRQLEARRKCTGISLWRLWCASLAACSSSGEAGTLSWLACKRSFTWCMPAGR